MHTFTSFIIRPDRLLTVDAFTVWGWTNTILKLPAEVASYGMVITGPAVLQRPSGQHCELEQGMYFSVNDGSISGGQGLIIQVANYRSLWQIGGPLEPTGRLSYIDGCSDTLLISPPRLGDPCLNHLHIPSHTDQTPHTHPSARLGIILNGSGECRTPDGIYPLQPGIGWYIPAGCLHSFFTRSEALNVIAWHPDSDFGPCDNDHPMINRTIIDR